MYSYWYWSNIYIRSGRKESFNTAEADQDAECILVHVHVLVLVGARPSLCLCDLSCMFRVEIREVREQFLEIGHYENSSWEGYLTLYLLN